MAIYGGDSVVSKPSKASDPMADIDKRYDEAVQLKEQGDLKGAVAALKEIVSEQPEHVVSHAALAVYQQQLGEDDDAISHAIKVTELEPDDNFSFVQLSVIYQRCGRIPEAEAAMAKAHEVNMRR